MPTAYFTAQWLWLPAAADNENTGAGCPSHEFSTGFKSDIKLICILLFAFNILTPFVIFADDVHDPAIATTQFEVHPELEVGLFAAEPLLANPTNIDIDHLGRVWICEVVNYRHRIANGDLKEREAGDRILILEDTDGDAKADKETVFYQGRDIDSAHGICVLGDRAIVSAGDSVVVLSDTDGDLKADKKEILFTGIGGVQHDHGIHAFVLGPDGKLYFNFGNEGKQICDANGQPIIDRAGNQVNNQRTPYQQGMVFRCDLDGSNFETLAWNFRNNWEIAVDSFGSLWQSDNDDDGNRGVRINYVMPHGNYGYVQELTGSGWREPRTGMHDEIPKRHWHQNDPGVVPNLLQTGAGSPTGMCIYEGDALPPVFHDQMIHCDAGPNIVRSYSVKKSGAGYTAEIVNLIDGAAKNQWFRPTDVCVAPDGSLIVADWYDPGVGGHRMRDIERGRLFRITSKGEGSRYVTTPPDFSTPTTATEALKSPNLATRFLAWQAIQGFGDEALAPLAKMWHDSNPRFRARALWAIGKLPVTTAEKLRFIREALSDSDPDLRITGIRLARQLQHEITFAEIEDVVRLDDPAPEFRREILITLREWPTDQLPSAWASLADHYPAGDRWYLEALGIAAEGHWDECLEAWLPDESDIQARLASPAARDILWRSRGSKSAKLIGGLIKDPNTLVSELPRYFRAFDFLKGQTTTEVLIDLAFGSHSFPADKSRYVQLESVKRLETGDLTAEHREQLNDLIEQSRGTPPFIEFVNRFASEAHYDDLLNMAATETDKQMAADAMNVLIEKQQLARIQKFLGSSEDDQKAESVMDSLANCGQRRAVKLLERFANRTDLPVTPRQLLAVKKLGKIPQAPKTW